MMESFELHDAHVRVYYRYFAGVVSIPFDARF